MMPPSEAATLEHLALNAWPALRVVVQGNWLLRFADGYTKRANSVNALSAERDTPAGELERRVAAAEMVYRRQDIACIFKLSPLMDPGLDAVLAARGYTHLDETLMMVADLTAGPGAVAMPSGVDVDVVRGEAWSRTYGGFNSVPPSRQSIHDRMLDSLVPVGGFALASEDGAPVAPGWVCSRAITSACSTSSPTPRADGPATGGASSRASWRGAVRWVRLVPT